MQHAHARARAKKLGVTVAAYLRYLIDKDLMDMVSAAKDLIPPTYELPGGWDCKR